METIASQLHLENFWQTTRPTFGRPASARRARPGHGAPPGRVPNGRAAVEPRCEAARAHALGTRRVAPAARSDLHLRYARPDRSHDDVGSDRHDGFGPHLATRHPERAVRTSCERESRVFHRQPRDQSSSRARRRRRTCRTVRSTAALHGRPAGRVADHGRDTTRGGGTRRPRWCSEFVLPHTRGATPQGKPRS